MTDRDLTLSVLHPSRFVKAPDLKGKRVTVTIERVVREQVPMTQGKKSWCAVITMKGREKQFISNVTNSSAITLLLGTDRCVEWTDRRIQLEADVDVDKKTRKDIPCIRVVGSPDATPEGAAAFARAWKGTRKGGLLVERYKAEIAAMSATTALPIVPADPEPVAPAGPLLEDDFTKDPT